MSSLNFDTNIILENERVRIRPLVEEDWELLLEIAVTEKMLLQYSPAVIYTETHLKNYIEEALIAKRNQSQFPFIIFDKHQGKFAGSTRFMNISNKDLRLEIGSTWIGQAFQGTGLNKACKFLLLSYAFETLEFERVELRADERNTKSRRAIEKIGGQYEGISRSHTVMPDGYRRDTVYYGLLKNDWKTIKETFFANFL
jgi:N-acetyltransferase